MSSPEVWPLACLQKLDPGEAVTWCTPAVAEVVNRALPIPSIESLEDTPERLGTLIAIGGGTRLDEAKFWRCHSAPDTRLVAIPSLWGSGAEASPVAVLDRGGEKEIHVGDEYLPDARCLWPELAAGISETMAAAACGDVWAHALEGFTSPLAGEDLRRELSQVITEMLRCSIGNDPTWFELSARACSAQARSSVGLVHGFAHVLEHPLRTRDPGRGWGHAKLCATFLHPVMSYNLRGSDRLKALMESHGLDWTEIDAVLTELFDQEAYDQAMELATEHWRAILTDRCTRTNCAVVRRGALEYFRDLTA